MSDINAVKISRADNGFVVEYPSDGDEDPGGHMLYPDRQVWVGPGRDPLPACEMFHDLAAYLGVSGTKHDAERLSIQVVKREET